MIEPDDTSMASDDMLDYDGADDCPCCEGDGCEDCDWTGDYCGGRGGE